MTSDEIGVEVDIEEEVDEQDDDVDLQPKRNFEYEPEPAPRHSYGGGRPTIRRGRFKLVIALAGLGASIIGGIWGNAFFDPAIPHYTRDLTHNFGEWFVVGAYNFFGRMAYILVGASIMFGFFSLLAFVILKISYRVVEY